MRKLLLMSCILLASFVRGQEIQDLESQWSYSKKTIIQTIDISTIDSVQKRYALEHIHDLAVEQLIESWKNKIELTEMVTILQAPNYRLVLKFPEGRKWSNSVKIEDHIK